MYNSKSNYADEFISHEEIIDTLDWAVHEGQQQATIYSILEKAELMRGLNHREAAALLMCDDQEIKSQIFNLARKIKKRYYGNRIVMFAPLYLSNYCINGCVYCPYHAKNKDIKRIQLTQEEIRKEVIALQDMGHKRLALEAGEDPINNTMDYYLESIKTIYETKHRNGSIRRVNINVAATTVEDYRKLKAAGIGTYILFQETYHRKTYEELHPSGPKSDYGWHTEAMDRAMDGGIDDVGIGVLFGLDRFAYDFVGLLMHVEHLEASKGVGPHTISVPRIRPASDVSAEDFDNAVSDEQFTWIVACLRVAEPYCGMIISTRESQDVRGRVLELGISQMSGGSRTSVGGYSDVDHEVIDETAQFDIADHRTLDEVVYWLMTQDHIPSFCTACYRSGRTGDRFMSLLKSEQIVNCCQPNALMTLQEYLEDYASLKTKKLGETLIARGLHDIGNEKIRLQTIDSIEKIKQGKRDLCY